MKHDIDVSVTVTTMKSEGCLKCPRCSQWTHTEHLHNLCNRCLYVVVTEYPDFHLVPAILENLKQRGLSPLDNPYKPKV